jgi:hypothetical protein
MGRRLASTVAGSVTTVVAYLALAPAVVNGDGLGYLDASVYGGSYAGHLLYVPLLRLLRRIFSVGPRPVDGLWVARGLSALSAGIAVLALGAAAERLFGDDDARPRASTVAALGLACSFGTLGAGSDVETYAPALACLCVALWAIVGGRTVAAALALAGAALFHVENVLFGLPALLALPKRSRFLFVGIAAGATAGAYLVAGASPSWLLGASHGFRYPLHWYTPAVALYGACKALLFSPYPYEASWPRVVGHFVPGALALILLGRIAASAPAALGRAASLAWAIPYGAVGVAFFASDQERWVFLLPLFWLQVAAARPRARTALAVACALGALNVAVWLPRARDSSWRDRARVAASHARAGDLIVSPGHGWDEYLGFYDGPPVGHYPLVFHAGRLGSVPALTRDLAAAVADARRRGHDVLLVRFDPDGDPMGWKELRPFGVTPENARALLPDDREVPLGDGVYRLQP